MASRPAQEGPGDIEQLAKGGRTNFFGFLLRLAARLPFLFIAGRWYGADALGRFAYATIIVEFAGQLATMGLKRGLAQQLSNTRRPHVHVVWDGLLVGFLASFVTAGILIAVPEIMFPNSQINGMDRLLALTIFGWAGSDIALAALAYRGDIGASVRARSLIEPWTISIAAFAFAFYSTRDGLIIAYALSAIAAFGASLWPLFRSYGRPDRWRPEPLQLGKTALRNLPIAGADAIEWGSRRLDIAMLGLFFSPAIVGIYYVAQQVASLPQKLKTSFDPILGPVITQNLAEDNLGAVAKQVRQVGFWIIAAQLGIALALSIPGKAVMGLVGPSFVGGTGALAVLLAAEAIAATAVVSEAALIYVAAKRNFLISLLMIATQALLSVALVWLLRAILPSLADWHWVQPRPDENEDVIAAAGPAIALMLALGGASVAKALLLRRILRAKVSGWRWSLVFAAIVAAVTGWAVTRLPHSLEWVELAIGVPLILGVYGAIVWRFGFTTDDRALFRKHPTPATA
ncbi:oligosaccharide flippase family protein [Sphingomonas sp. AP4-R1]|uniref:lipopolysaccharide biosynthesis protein n=1 Tax=Sphingomonas sp. AP4-R1 TaxID=2735134 RepID=UPI001493CD0D|nr:oligosaccharide flippase family protein [Sphingomonas sp. AP4-R1]QJU57883.1 oligosaccharide flippase family protein [Sphingomonas sp. AP4-R1]